MGIIRDQTEDERAAWRLLPQGSLAAQAVAWLIGHTSEAYLVGGHIRDWLLGRESHDVDLAVARDSLSLARSLADYLGCYFVPLDPQRGIARVVCHEEGEIIYVDLTLLQGQSLAQDLMHRDFTINAIALRLGTETLRLIDPYHGRSDLHRRLMRVVTPHAFVDDPLRLLRAVRFAAELGFEIEPQTEALLRKNTPLIRLPAAERIRYELVKILRTPQAPRWVHFLMDTGLLVSILPQLEPHLSAVVETFTQLHQLIAALKKGNLRCLGLQTLTPFTGHLLDYLSPTTSEARSREDVLRMTALLSLLTPDEVMETLLGLRFSSHEAHSGRDIVAHWRRVHQFHGLEASPRTIYRFFLDTGDAGIEALLLALSRERRVPQCKRLTSSAAPLLEAYFHHYREVIAPPLLLDGHGVMEELRLGPGPAIGEALASLREAQAVGEVHTLQEAVAFVRAWASIHGLDGCR